MVTIEQKLSMFTKLMQRSMNEGFTSEMAVLKKDYEKKLLENKVSVDKEVDIIIRKAQKKAEIEKSEILSKSDIIIKKEYMSAKEALFSTMLLHLKDKIDQFVQSKEYEGYLLSLIKNLEETKSFSNDVIIYMTKKDYAKYGEIIKRALPKIKLGEVSFQEGEDKIIGGLVLVNTITSTRMDF